MTKKKTIRAGSARKSPSKPRATAATAGGRERAFDGIKAAFGIPGERALDLAAPMYANVSRLGYAEEGLRLTFSINSPYDYHCEIQLSRADAEWLRGRLAVELSHERNANMPDGRR